MFIPKRVTKKWLKRISREQLEELRSEFRSGSLRRIAVDGEIGYRERLREAKPCKHPGCLSHVTHPCEGCGRTAGKEV